MNPEQRVVFWEWGYNDVRGLRFEPQHCIPPVRELGEYNDVIERPGHALEVPVETALALHSVKIISFTQAELGFGGEGVQ